MRRAVAESFPQLVATARCKHAQASFVEQRDAGPTPKNRGGEQGDGKGPLECGVTLGVVERATCRELHDAQHSGRLVWATDDGAKSVEAAEAWVEQKTETRIWQLRAQAAKDSPPPNPASAIVKDGGLVHW